jgi:hypothetical protein
LKGELGINASEGGGSEGRKETRREAVKRRARNSEWRRERERERERERMAGAVLMVVWLLGVETAHKALLRNLSL